MATSAGVVLLSLPPLAAAVAKEPKAVPAAPCGRERWAVKTLTDRRAKRVSFTPKATTVRSLRSRKVPKRRTIRNRGVESSTYRVRAALIEAKLEGDRDIHLVIADRTNLGKTMIVEFPDTACPEIARSKRSKAMTSARAAFLAACGTPPRAGFAHLSGVATITGVGFFDGIHGQVGVARNGIELHPVLRLRNNSCARI
jgi:hypothetical protein